MFSVIIPLYNKASYIEKAIESVLKQTMPDFELIIVNDGSTDDSVGKLTRFSDTRLKLISQENAGVSTARNNGAEQAQFDYIAFLDADDWWHEHFLEEMKALITQFPEAGLYGSNYFIVKNSTNKPAQVGLDPDFKAGYIDYFAVYARTFWVPINCSFVIVRKSAFVEVEGLRPALKFGEDLDLWIRVALKHRVGYVNKFLAYSNQDAETANRALGATRCWRTTEHVIFNLGFLAEPEKDNPTLKFLLDGLRVRSLVDYYLNAWYPEDVRAVLDQVDFDSHPRIYRFIYQWPLPLVIAYYRIKQVGSLVKQTMLCNYRQLFFVN